VSGLTGVNSSPTYFNLGLTYEIKGDVAKALELYRHYNALATQKTARLRSESLAAEVPVIPGLGGGYVRSSELTYRVTDAYRG
jgi:hypothetical protein